MLDLVMIPAFGCDARLYQEIVPALGRDVRPITVIAEADTLETCVADVLAAAPQRFVALGTSFGGRVALELAVAAPQRVAGLIVMGSDAGPSPEMGVGLRRSRRLREGEMENVLAEMGAMVAHLPGARGPATRDMFIAMGRDLGAEAMARQSDSLARRSDLRPALTAIACPALMLWGKYDLFVSAAAGLALSAAIPGARYAEIDGIGHFPSLEAPAETANVICHWLADAGLIPGL